MYTVKLLVWSDAVNRYRDQFQAPCGQVLSVLTSHLDAILPVAAKVEIVVESSTAEILLNEGMA